MSISITISENVEDARYTYSNYKIYYCNVLPYNDFIRLHQKNLFSTSERVCFLGLEEYESDKLIKLSSEEINIDIIWVFSKLAKNTKLYKSLSEKFTIKILSNLSYFEKIKFITSLLVDRNLDTKLVNTLVNKLPSDRSIIKNELDKLEILIKLDKDLSLDLKYEKEFIIFDLLKYFLEKDIKNFYKTADIVDLNLDRFAVGYFFLKRLLALLYINLGDLDSANKYFKYFGKSIKYDQFLSKKLLFHNILELYLKAYELFIQIDTVGYDYSLFQRLMKFYRIYTKLTA